MAQGKERTEADDGQSVNERSKTVCRSMKPVQSEGSLQGVKDQAQSNLPVLHSTGQVEEPGASLSFRASPTNALLIPPSFDKNQLTTLRRYSGEAAGTNVNAESIFDDNSVGLFDPQQSNAPFYQIPQLDDLILHTDGTVLENHEGLGWNLSNPEAAFGFAEGVSEEGIDEAIWQIPELSLNKWVPSIPSAAAVPERYS
ncbi:hypothetical protein H2201_007796 [Coniosporium apollinis]|uniref:Uncharacterized protein n=1 Tax=Coniosporium apollinis TaxID=61459 RepID=A0ABQ9NPT5_9PEZI|nr:hypothetical protein H2201_007796 [Coniosporium apollinis]